MVGNLEGLPKHWTLECRICQYRRANWCCWAPVKKRLLDVPVNQWRHCSCCNDPPPADSISTLSAREFYKPNEAQIKHDCEERLQIRQNMGELIYLRLNSGDAIVCDQVAKGKGCCDSAHRKTRRIRGCPKGTLDLYVLKDGQTYFLDTKVPGEGMSRGQRQFAQLVREQGAIAKVIRSVDEMDEVLDKTPVKVRRR